MNTPLINTAFDFDFFGITIQAFGTMDAPLIRPDELCRHFGVDNPYGAVRALDKEQVTYVVMDTPGGKQKVTMVTFRGAIMMMLNGRRPEARAFREHFLGKVLGLLQADPALVRQE